jgi:carbon-monoxide dehydrogenase large subunit
VCEALGVARADVTVVCGDTETTPYGVGSEGSRALVVAGSAVHVAALRVRAKATELAAHLLEAAVEDLAWDGDRVAVRGVPSRAWSLYELAQLASQGADRPPGMDPGLEATGAFDPEDFTYPSGTHVCLVEVDPETGHVEVVRYVAVDDCGRRISPAIVEGQVHGGVAQGIGQALLEDAGYEADGTPRATNLLTYALPTAPDLPAFTAGALETPTDRNPLGAKGAGEAGTIGAPPAVVNAVVDALAPLGVVHIDMPLTPERVWRAIREATMATAAPAIR